MKTFFLKPVILAALVAASLTGCRLFNQSSLVFEGTSMLPTIKNGQRLKVLRFDRGAKFDVKHGDIIAFWFPDDPSSFYIKRLIALPGDTIEIDQGVVILNGNKLNESYVDMRFNLARRSHPSTYIKPHHYYVIGDNRDNSSDSRYWGLVPEKYIFGRVLL